MINQMKHTLLYAFLSLAMLFATAAVDAQAPSDAAIKITLETNPQQVRAGQPFEMIWRVAADDAQVLKVFADTADAFGPEHAWTHDGAGAFVAKVKRTEETPGQKEYELWAKLDHGGAARFVGESFRINVADQDGDQNLADFLSWLKDRGYSDEIIRIHAHDGAKPLVRKAWERYFKKRNEPMPYRELETMPLVFVDVIATDDAAGNELLEGQMDKLEGYMQFMFGKDFDIQYHQERIAYEKQFGEPTLMTNAKGDVWLKLDSGKQLKYARQITQRITEERDLPSNAVIVRWAGKTWQHDGETLKIQDLTGSSPANSAASFTVYGLGLYAHEWGHDLGIGHMFVNGAGSFRSRVWGLECIMNHSYVAYANRDVGRLLSPLLRYALEPEYGFEDQATFASQYSKAMAGTEMLKSRLEETQTATTVATTMAWSTPWRTENKDSVICKGLRNRNYEIKRLELLPGIEPGAYALVVGTDGRSDAPEELILQKDGQPIARTTVDHRAKVSEQTTHTITIENYLSLDIGRSRRGSSNLYGIGQLLHERPLVVPVDR